ncbi:hypothetical protein AVEN_150854-1 [Araneus ventricosus]|uniref:Uncharacterized protein n=1 Tax=Araneus ventricosus TaxID=182803 RepID=A0A4Y2JU70_ARAVE|nr:hypothetical protein AVEN_150854-1 [Araneus ventricosus]
MGFYFTLQLTSILNVFWLSCFLKNIESIPVSSPALLIPGTTNSSAELEHLKFSSDESREEKNVSSHVLNNQLEEVAGESTEYAETNASKKKSLKNLLSPMMVPYLCDIEKRMCWLNENQGDLVTVFIPINRLPDKQPPTEIELKELYSLVTMKKKLQMDSLDSSHLNSTAQYQQRSSDAHRRRKRDTQYAEANDNPQQEWTNQGENEGYQSFRAQRDVPSTTDATSTEGRKQRNVDLQASKQSKRSAELDEDEVEDKDFGSPSPDEDYQDEDDAEYQPEKRFAGQETTGETPKSGDSPTKTPSQLYRREVMNPNYNYPFFANPDLYYPSQRLLSPFDGISYRSVDAMPMWYMGGYPAFWQGRGTRNPQQYRQAGGYGRGWPPAPPYYQPYANRYQPPSYPTPAQPHRGHYQHQYPKQPAYNAYKPFSYGYAQGNKNYQTPVRKPIETDANMYYGK